jgi:hypothetical protein
VFTTPNANGEVKKVYFAVDKKSDLELVIKRRR